MDVVNPRMERIKSIILYHKPVNISTLSRLITRYGVYITKAYALYIIKPQGKCTLKRDDIQPHRGWWYAPHFVRRWYAKPADWIKKSDKSKLVGFFVKRLRKRYFCRSLIRFWTPTGGKINEKVENILSTNLNLLIYRIIIRLKENKIHYYTYNHKWNYDGCGVWE